MYGDVLRNCHIIVIVLLSIILNVIRHNLITYLIRVYLMYTFCIESKEKAIVIW